MPQYKDSFADYDERKICVNWKAHLWDEHLKKHPELIDFQTTSALIKEAITDPDIVMQGNRDGDAETTLCYYKQISGDRSFIRYTKIVVGCNTEPHYVKSVFCKSALIEFVIQEKKYPQFKEIWKNQNSYL